MSQPLFTMNAPIQSKKALAAHDPRLERGEERLLASAWPRAALFGCAWAVVIARALGATAQDAPLPPPHQTFEVNACSQGTGVVSWPCDARPAWVDAAHFSLQAPHRLASGVLEVHVALIAAAPMPACALEVVLGRASMPGTPHEGARLERPTHVVADSGSVQRAEYVVRLPEARAGLQVATYLFCPDGVHFTGERAGESYVVDEARALAGLCAMRPARWRVAADVSLGPENTTFLIGPRLGAVLRRDGDRIVDACTQHVVLDLAALGLTQAATVSIPALGSPVSPRERALLVEGVGSPSLHEEWNGEAFEVRLEAPVGASFSALTRALRGAREIAIVWSRDGMIQP